MTAPDHVLDPDGDVIITLREFNKPFPPNTFKNISSPWESAPEESFSADITKLSLWNKIKYEDAAQKKVKKSKKKKRVREEPDTMEEARVLPEEDEMLHEALSRSLAIAEHPSATTVEAPPGDPGAAEAIEAVETTEIALQIPDEDLDNDEHYVEPPEPCIRFQVSSAHLRLGSRYFKNALDGRFSESYPAADGFRYIDADGWDVFAFLTVMRVFHGQNRQVPKVLGLEMLAKVAVIVDYYQCHEILEPFTDIWHFRMGKLSIPDIIDSNLVLLLCISWAFGWPEEFRLVTKIAQNESKGPICTMGLPIPNHIISVIDEQRRGIIQDIKSVLLGLLRRFSQERPDCSEACFSMQLGALERQLLHKGELQFYSFSGESLTGYSVASAIKATREMRTPNPDRYSSYHDCSYGLDRLLRQAIENIKVLEGLNLESFKPG